MTTTITEPTIKSLEIATGHQPYNSSFAVWVFFNGLPGKTLYKGKDDRLTVEVDYQHGTLAHSSTLRVALSSSNYQFTQRSGIRGVGQIKGLKKRCIEICDEFRSSFRPTLEQTVNMQDGKLNEKFSLVLKSSNEAHVSFNDLSIGQWVFDGVLGVKPNPADKSKLLILYTSHGGTRLVEHETKKRHEAGDCGYGHISVAAKAIIYEYIRPAVEQQWAWSLQQRRQAARNELQQQIKHVEEQITFDKSQLQRHEDELKDLRDRVAQQGVE